ncbi:hypothetical protein D3C75_1191010 [compost metagenome]
MVALGGHGIGQTVGHARLALDLRHHHHADVFVDQRIVGERCGQPGTGIHHGGAVGLEDVFGLHFAHLLGGRHQAVFHHPL